MSTTQYARMANEVANSNHMLFTIAAAGPTRSGSFKCVHHSTPFAHTLATRVCKDPSPNSNSMLCKRSCTWTSLCVACLASTFSSRFLGLASNQDAASCPTCEDDDPESCRPTFRGWLDSGTAIAPTLVPSVGPTKGTPPAYSIDCAPQLACNNNSQDRKLCSKARRDSFFKASTSASKLCGILSAAAGSCSSAAPALLLLLRGLVPQGDKAEGSAPCRPERCGDSPAATESAAP
mmetsp:Transcript_89216/g.249651  ORF Transcript_89216/g.249651 Transcript_89216/m.249651 type:complete len:235 (-) Transcript_89216:85-789(-)